MADVWIFTSAATSPDGVVIETTMTVPDDTPDVRENAELVQMAVSHLFSRMEQAREHRARREAERIAEALDRAPF